VHVERFAGVAGSQSRSAIRCVVLILGKIFCSEFGAVRIYLHPPGFAGSTVNLRELTQKQLGDVQCYLALFLPWILSYCPS
jgi:hypothetical protein